jgi:2'-5' RNA ligase
MTFYRKLLNRLGAVVERLNRQPGPVDQVHLAVVIPLGAEAAHQATGLQIEILRKYGYNPGLDAYPHITLKMGFDVTDIAPFEALLEKIASEVRPFEITVRTFNSFEEGILFLDVEPSSALEELRQQILAELSAKHGIKPLEIEGPQFHFHVTLADGFTRHQFDELKKSHIPRKVEIKFTARQLALFCHTGSHWVCCKQAKLRDQVPSA